MLGTLDSTPISDLLNLGLHLDDEDWMNAAISAASMTPYVGDLTKTMRAPLGKAMQPRTATNVFKSADRASTASQEALEWKLINKVGGVEAMAIDSFLEE
jgi:hypothetical protein